MITYNDFEKIEKPNPTKNYYSIAEHLAKSGCPAEAALVAVYTIDDTLESIDIDGLRRAIHECLPLIEQIKAGNRYQRVLKRIYNIISPVQGVGAEGAEAIVRLFTPNRHKKESKEESYKGLW